MKSLNLTPGSYSTVVPRVTSIVRADYEPPRTIRLPDGVKAAGWETVDVVITREGRIVIIVKTFIWAKGNFGGVVYSPTPLLPEDFGLFYNRRAVMIAGLPVSFVESSIKNNCVRVFFDLG